MRMSTRSAEDVRQWPISQVGVEVTICTTEKGTEIGSANVNPSIARVWNLTRVPPGVVAVLAVETMYMAAWTVAMTTVAKGSEIVNVIANR